MRLKGVNVSLGWSINVTHACLWMLFHMTLACQSSTDASVCANSRSTYITQQQRETRAFKVWIFVIGRPIHAYVFELWVCTCRMLNCKYINVLMCALWISCGGGRGVYQRRSVSHVCSFTRGSWNDEAATEAGKVCVGVQTRAWLQRMEEHTGLWVAICLLAEVKHLTRL